jgi:hypothetical protein
MVDRQGAVKIIDLKWLFMLGMFKYSPSEAALLEEKRATEGKGEDSSLASPTLVSVF